MFYMKKFDLNIGDTIFVYRYTNKSMKNDYPESVFLNKDNLINHWKGTYVTQYVIIDGIKIRVNFFGNPGTPFSTIVRLSKNNSIILSSSYNVCKARIKLEYDRIDKLLRKKYGKDYWKI